MYTQLQISMLEADTITALERNVITQAQFNNRILKLNKMKDDLKEKEQEYINEMWEQEREVQISMSRGGL